MAGLNNLKLGTKIVGGFVFVSLLVLAAGGAGLIGLRAVGGGFDAVVGVNVPQAHAAMEMSISAGRLTELYTEASLTQDPAVSQEITEAKSDFETSLTGAREVFTGEQAAELDAIESVYEEFSNTGDRLVAAYAESDAAGDAAMPEFDKDSAGLDEALKSLESDASAAMAAAMAGADRTQATMNTTPIVVAVVSLALSLAIGFYLTRAIAGPAQRMAMLADDFAAGGLGDVLEQGQRQAIADRGDEIGQMGKGFLAMERAFRQMSEAAQRIAEYDLSADVQPRSERDLLGNSLHTMILNLRQAFGTVRDGVDSAAAAASQMSEAASTTGEGTQQVSRTIEQVAKGSASTAASVNEANQSMEELARAIDGIAKGAQESAGAVGAMSSSAGMVAQTATDIDQLSRAAREEAQSGQRVAQEGLQAMQATMEGMRSIQSVCQEAATKVQDMGQRSQEISRIVGTIEDIASQTNLLALNAQIEAARAGEQGRGFAVVADEVRKLAERSARATQEIGELIKAVQEGSAGAVGAMNRGADEVSHGAELAQKAEQVIGRLQGSVQTIVGQVGRISDAGAQLTKASGEMMTEVERVSAVVEESSAASEEMAASSTRVSESLTSVAAIAEEASAAAQEVAASTEELTAQVEEMTALAGSVAEQADEMRQAVEQFKLGDGHQASARGTAAPARAAAPARGAARRPAERVAVGAGGNGHR